MRRRILASLAKSGYTAKDYVQDGLIAMWDGIENAGWGVHDDNATVWKNLIQDGNDWLISDNGSWEQYGLRGNGLGYCATGATLGRYMTIEFLFKPNIVGNQKCLMMTGKNNYDGMQYFYMAKENFSFGRSYCFGEAKLGKVYHLAYENTTLTENGAYKGFINSVLIDDSKYSSGDYMAAGSGVPAIFGRIGGDRNLDGLAMCIRAYNRQLSDSEIAENYAIDKARFNLPDAA